MSEVKNEYTLLFNGISEVIHDLERTVRRLKALQQAAEATYMTREEEARQEYSGEAV